MLSIDIYLLSTGYLLISIRYLSDTYSMSVWFGEEKDRCLQRSTVLVGEFFGCPSLLKPNLLQLAMSAQSIPETQPDDTKRCAGSCHHAHKAVCPLMSPHKVTTQSGVPAHATIQSGVPAHVTTQSGVPADVMGKQRCARTCHPNRFKISFVQDSIHARVSWFLHCCDMSW